MFSEILSQFLNHLVPYHFRGDSIVLQELADLVMRDIIVIHPASELIGECDVISVRMNFTFGLAWRIWISSGEKNT